MKNLKLAGKVLGILVLVVIGLGILGNFLPEPPKAKPPEKSDKELVKSFYSEMISKTNEADQLYKPFASSLEKSDILGATQVALQIDQPFRSLWGQIDRLDTPDLQNDAAEKKLGEAKKALAGCYLCKTTVVSDFIKFSESPNMKKMAEIANTARNSQTLLLGGIAYLFEAGEMVGLKPTDLK